MAPPSQHHNVLNSIRITTQNSVTYRQVSHEVRFSPLHTLYWNNEYHDDLMNFRSLPYIICKMNFYFSQATTNQAARAACVTLLKMNYIRDVFVKDCIKPVTMGAPLCNSQLVDFNRTLRIPEKDCGRHRGILRILEQFQSSNPTVGSCDQIKSYLILQRK